MFFLSRLCGGELVHRSLVTTAYFLSRLYGGERSSPCVALLSYFLSRLYGGELCTLKQKISNNN